MRPDPCCRPSFKTRIDKAERTLISPLSPVPVCLFEHPNEMWPSQQQTASQLHKIQLYTRCIISSCIYQFRVNCWLAMKNIFQSVTLSYWPCNAYHIPIKCSECLISMKINKRRKWSMRCGLESVSSHFRHIQLIIATMYVRNVPL